MKKYAMGIMVALAFLLFIGPALGQRANRGPGLEAREDPSLDRSRGGRGGGQGGFRGGRLDVESTNRALEEIEKQVAAIKKALEEMQPSSQPQPGADFRALMQAMREKTDAAMQSADAISDQALVIKGRQARIAFQEEIAELQSIATMAKEENAAKTDALIQSLIESRQKAFQEKSEKLGIPTGGRGDRGFQGGGPGGARRGQGGAGGGGQRPE